MKNQGEHSGLSKKPGKDGDKWAETESMTGIKEWH